MRFPLPFVPKISYKGGNGFGASRDKVRKGLRHAANDLAAPPHTPVLAMEDGMAVSDLYSFYSGTYAIEVKHSQFIARYGELSKTAEIKNGDHIKEGQVIGYVGDQPGQDMLHLEFFSGKKTGRLSTSPGTHPPYDRRDDVFDGVKYLDDTRASATFKDDPKNVYNYYTDDTGRKFIKTDD